MSNQSMTFDEARRRNLEELRGAWDDVYAIVAQPDWCNKILPTYKLARNRVEHAIERVRRLNCAANDVFDHIRAEPPETVIDKESYFKP